MSSIQENRQPHRWRFVRIGGFDQVRIDTAADILHLDQLDPKLWVALSCPVKGVEFDTATLALLDADNDGHVRVPEFLAASAWLGKVLKHHEPISHADGRVTLSAINEADPEGARLLGSANSVLASLGKEGAAVISTADTADIAAIYARMRFNGDGIITADLASQHADTVALIIDTLGSELDRSNKPGIDAARINRFFDDAAALLSWQEKGLSDAAVRALGDNTDAAAAAFQTVRAKIDDYFTRVRLAAFDAKAAALLNPADTAYSAFSGSVLASSRDEIAALPLAHIGTDATLNLVQAINPAWHAAIQTFRTLAVTPVIGEREQISEAEWEKISRTFDAYGAWLAAKPVSPVEKAGNDVLRAQLDSGARDALLALVDKDLAAAPEAEGIAALDKLLRYCRDLLPLANNFVSFSQFYNGGKAVFQAGSLFLDGRSCDLTVKVLDAGKHASLATLSGVCLVYCDCVRGDRKMQIAAAFTDGDADELRVGRNGVFWDRNGQDWDATITKIIEHPISIRQAFWSPYKKVSRLIGEQINKFAAAKADGVDSQLSAGTTAGTDSVASGKAPATPPAPFDIGKFVGIFAAIGLAIGAIGGVLAAVASGFLTLKLWQMPLAVIGVMLLISGPSMLLAFLKLRRRNLGPILDANGWAVNARARINIPFGQSLTQMAVLPEGSERSLIDPYADKKPAWPWLLLAVVLVVGGWLVWKSLNEDSQEKANTAAAAASPATSASSNAEEKEDVVVHPPVSVAPAPMQ